jgi:hypothetical protein
VNKKVFPYQIHIVLGLVWIVIGTTLYSGIGLVVWVGGGLIMTIVGLLNKKKSK